jgi:tripartite-type tricarboxylate transporter receptor subunit TctC
MNMRNLMRYVVTALAAMALLSSAVPACAQKAYPTKPIRFISPFSAGGSTDILARIIGQKLNEAWGQPVVVENRPGAGGNLGAEVVAKAAPDAHTLLLSASSVAINPSLYTTMPFDTAKDLAPVGLAGMATNILLVHPSVPVYTVQQFIDLARRKPSSLQYASGGSGTGSHLIAELFQHEAHIRLIHVPYKGSGPATNALLSGECALAFNNMIAALPHVKSGRMRAIGVTGSQRAELLPDVPTISESAIPGFEADSWYGVFTTGRSPEDSVQLLNAELLKIVSLPDITKKFQAMGITVRKMSVAEFQTFMRSQMVKWEKVVKVANAKVE